MAASGETALGGASDLQATISDILSINKSGYKVPSSVHLKSHPRLLVSDLNGDSSPVYIFIYS